MTLELPFSIKIKESPAEILKLILSEIRTVLNKEFPRIAGIVQKKLRKNLGTIFYDSPEYKSIISTAHAEFGFEAGTATSRLRAIIDTLQDTVIVSHKKISVAGNTLRGGLLVEAFPDDFNYLFNLPESKVITESGEEIEWLFHMLLSGHKIIITDYTLEFGAGKGRSNFGKMVFRPGSAWRVPVDLAGTINDNWITRSVIASQKVIESYVADAVEQELSIIKV